MSLIAFGGAVVIGILGWAYGINPKIDKVDAKIEAKNELIASRHNSLKELIEVQFGMVNARLDRIDRSLNGHLRE